MATSRPTLYSAELADALYERLVSGRSLVSVCRDPDMPVEMTVFRWIRNYPEFARMDAHACEARTQAWAEQIIEIANGTKDDNPIAVQRDRLRIDTRKWLVAKCMPKKHGDKLDHEHGGSVRIIVRKDFDNEDDAELPSGAPRLIDAKPLQ